MSAAEPGGPRTADEQAAGSIAGTGIIDRMIGRGEAGPRPATRRTTLIELGIFAAIVVVAIVVVVNGTRYGVQLATDIAMFVVLAYSWNVISGFTGYISFGQVAFFGFGAYATSLLIIHAGIPWWLSAAIAGALCGLVAIPIGAVMLRLRGIYFALGMFGIVNVLSLIASRWELTGSGTGLIIPGELAQIQVFFWMIAAAALAFGLNFFMSRSRFGLRAMAIRDDEEVAAAMGVKTTRVKVMTFALSAVLPAFAGGLVAFNRSFINAPSAFAPAIDLQTILFAMAGGIGTVWGPLIGAVSLELAGNQLWLNYPDIQLALFGGLIIVVLLFLPGGVVSLFNRFGMFRRTIVRAPAALPEGAAPEAVAANGGGGGRLLECRDVGVSFGGVHALQDVSLTVERGETVCIIGANGAGKTTLFNAITGMVKPSAGEIIFNGERVAEHAPHQLAGLGLGRTFQIPRPFESMTVWENILLAADSGRRSANAVEHTAWVVRTLHLEDLWLWPVATLPVGHRRLVELARALALQPDLILLDEVMAGMTQEELERVRSTIREMGNYGVGAVAGVEHVIRAIVDLADRIVVLDEGKMIASGSPDAILRDPEVVRAYLGGDLQPR